MRAFTGFLAILLISVTAAEAQYQNRYYPGAPQYAPQYRTAPIPEDCPQGRQIRAQKSYPASMTDCQVLDAAVENRKRAVQVPPGRTQYGGTQPSSPPAPAPQADPIAAARTAAAAKVLQHADWRPLEADNGAIYKLDMNSIKPGNGGAAQITVYADEGRPTDIALNLKFLLFDCNGRFLDMNAPMSQSAYAPPKSVAGQIGAIACEKAHAMTAAVDTESMRIGLLPENYCKGFSAEACSRMKLVIDTKERPSFCKPGFGLVESGLTDEQRRICYVMTSSVFH
jgi:hypothetical protein